MKTAIQKRQPHKIDIGAVFSAPPKDHTTIKPELFHTVERELVFDIDMTDYDEVRTCCSGANICRRCWPFMTMALKCVDTALREDFAFKHILWIYSGRRGIHCWVNDANARKLTNDARTAVVEYLSLAVEGKETKLEDELKKSKIAKELRDGEMHPHLRRSFSILEPYFADHIAADDGQGMFASKKSWIPVLNSIPDSITGDSIREELAKEFMNPQLDGKKRWALVKAKIFQSENGNVSNKKRKATDYPKLREWVHEIVFRYTYPRLDANVSKAMNHLLKSPFCVHPKTGRVCIPIDPREADVFDPFSVPTVRSLCAEIDAYDRAHPNEAAVTNDTEKTSLKAAVGVFKDTFMGDMWKAIKADFRVKAEEAAPMDF
jgi:DNA primase small subunit